MEEEENIEELREKLEEASEENRVQRKYLSLSTALIAVFAAIASLLSGDKANEAILAKNDAILNTSRASDQWNLYQSKGLKKNLNEAFDRQNHDSSLRAESERYRLQQDSISALARELEQKTRDDNERSEVLMKQHQKLALAVTLFQIAIAMSAISALLVRRLFWYFSLGAAAIALALLAIGLF